MNQAIIFTDHETWDSLHHGVVCIAMVNGFQVYCCVRAETLSQRFGSSSQPEQYIELFRRYRWDFEDELEALIEDEAFDDDGWIVI
jgi:hypothetical protein